MPSTPPRPLVCLLLSLGLGVGCEGQLSRTQDKPQAVSSTGSDDAGTSGGSSSQDGDATDDGKPQGTGGEGVEGPTDASVSFPDGVPVFVASGHMGRTVVSCDDGKTWVHDQSADDSARCFENDFDCDHNENAGTGLVYFDGWFVATFGWGAPGTIRRSQDGVSWQTTLDESTAGSSTTFAGLMAGERLIAGARNSKVSTDHGASWQNAGDTDFGEIYNVRTGGYSGFGGGRYVIVAEDSAHATRISSDGGQSWHAPSSMPGECGADPLRVAGSPDVILVVSRNGTVCSSNDGGDTFEAHDALSGAGGSLEAGAIWADGKFMIWGNKSGEGRVVLTSADGKAWSSQPGPDFSVGPVAYSPLSGTFVAVSDAWRGWYEAQRFYRSDDGLTWQELPSGSYQGGHPIRNIAFGTVPGSPICPGN